jgi:hypothetical protein
MIEADAGVTNSRHPGEHRESVFKKNQLGSDSFTWQQEQGHDRESATEIWLGTDPAQRQALAARLMQQWQQEAEQLVAQRHYQQAIAVYTRMLAVDPGHVQAIQG